MNGVLKNIHQRILHNPYRMLGVTCEASVRDVTRQSSRLKKYLLAEEKPTDLSIQYIDDLTRDIENVDHAIQAISTDEARIQHAIFWFWSNYSITDEPAFDMLKDGNPQGALEVWGKKIFEHGTNVIKPISNKNASAFHNWCILKLILLEKEKLSSTIYQNLAQIISVEMSLLDSQFWEQFKDSIVDKTYAISQEKIEFMFLNDLLDFEDACKIFWNRDIQDFIAKKDFCKKIKQCQFFYIKSNVSHKSLQEKSPGLLVRGFCSIMNWLNCLYTNLLVCSECEAGDVLFHCLVCQNICHKSV